MRLPALVLAGAFACQAFAAEEARITPFSSSRPGVEWPRGWKPLGLPNAKMPDLRLVDDAGVTVLQAKADSAAGTISYSLGMEPLTRPTLKWRWKVDRVVSAGDMMTRAHEDFAARVYVFFDVPREALPFSVRAKMKVAQLLYDAELPTATICYVWDNKYPVGTHTASPFINTVHTWVVQSGNGQANQWTSEMRNLEVDFRAAFGGFWKGPVPRVKGIAIGLDTDQAKESVTATFGDFELGAGP